MLATLSERLLLIRFAKNKTTVHLGHVRSYCQVCINMIIAILNKFLGKKRVRAGTMRILKISLVWPKSLPLPKKQAL